MSNLLGEGIDESGGLTDNPLSEREMDVARLIATGATNAEIARKLVISPHTVKVHLRNIFLKLGVGTRTEATIVLVQHGWLEVPGAVFSEDEIAEPPPPPDPQPLLDQPGQVAGWQRIWLAATVAVLLFMLAFPLWQSQASTSPPLLTDAGTGTGRPAQIESDARWQSLAPLPIARSRHGSALLNKRIYVMGGETEGGVLLNDLDAYDFADNRWVSRAPMPEAASNTAVAPLGDFVYVAGGTLTTPPGTESPPLNDRLWRYDEAANTWEDVGALPEAVAGASLAATEDALYLVGGWDGKSMRDEIWRWRPDRSDASAAEQAVPTPTVSPLPTPLQPAIAVAGLGQKAGDGWELVGRIPSPRSFLGAQVVDGELYVMGGFDGQRELARADAFSLDDGTWRPLSPMATPRSGFGLAHDGVALVAIGGGWLDTVETNERYDPAIDVWSNFPSPVRGSWRHLGVISTDGQLYMTGGWAGDYMANVLQYQSTFRSLLPVITNP